MNISNSISQQIARRTFLQGTVGGVGAAALAGLMDSQLLAAKKSDALASRGVVNPLHMAAKAKRVIFLCQAGGSSHLETFDHKPKLAEMHGKPMPQSITAGQPIAQLQRQRNNLKCFGPQHPFKKFGKSGQQICSLFPHIGSVADELCIVNSLKTEAINHDPAHTFMNTGRTIPGSASMGSWLTYGLGVEADDLPGFVVLTSVGKGGQSQPIAARQWHSGFLPSRYQGVEFRSTGEPVLYVGRPKGVNGRRQRDVVDAVNSLNQLQNAATNDPEIDTRISQYEMAFKMQTSVPDLMDTSKEPQHVLDMYGTKGGDGTYASNCLLARRMAQRGVRFIQLYHRAWDHHGNIKRSMEITSKEVDQPTAALIKDLKRLGMLDDTLIIWGTEFGRTPMAQGSGRDHHIKGMSMVLAGGGIKGGITYGATDDFGYHSVVDVVSVHDMHATMLHLLGIDHERFSYKYLGLDFRLSGVEKAQVVKKILL